LFGLATTFVQAWFITALRSFQSLQRDHSHHPPTPDIQQPQHTRMHTHIQTHTYTQIQIYAHMYQNTNKIERMKRGVEGMQSCADINKSSFEGKKRGEQAMPCHYQRKKASNKPGEKGPIISEIIKQKEQKITQTPQPRAVQSSKRRQSSKCPVGDRADLVAGQGPAPENHRVSKRSQRSPTPHRHPNPGNRRHTSVPSPLCPSACLCYSSLYSLLVSRVRDAFPVPCTPAKSQTITKKSLCNTPACGL
jgi:hypothetical protein